MMQKVYAMRKIHDAAFLDNPIPTAGPNDAVVRTTSKIMVAAKFQERFVASLKTGVKR